jgi:hypothetical protein
MRNDPLQKTRLAPSAGPGGSVFGEAADQPVAMVIGEKGRRAVLEMADADERANGDFENENVTSDGEDLDELPEVRVRDV